MSALPPAPRIDAADENVLLRSLLPRYYFTADAAAGGAFEAALSVFADSFAELRGGVASLYDRLFVDTCPPWLLPYLADQVGIVPLPGERGRRNRAWVGRGVALRRRRGTLDALVTACRIASGFAVEATPGLQEVSATASLRHRGLPNGAWADVRDAPGDARRSVSISGRPSRGAAGRVGEGAFPHPSVLKITVWRTRALWVDGARAAAVEPRGGGRAFTFHALGVDTPLFDRGLGRERIPRPLTRGDLERRIEDDERLPFWIRTGGAARRARELRAADLRDWAVPPPGVIAVDPERGRFVFGDDPATPVEVGFAFGTPGEIGGGPYPRRDRALAGPTAVVGEGGSASLDDVLSLTEGEGRDVHVEISGSTTDRPVGGRWHLGVPGGRRVRITAAPGAVPVLDGPMTIVLGRGAVVELTGLLVAREVSVRGDGLLSLQHCTIAPAGAALSLARGVTASIDASIVGRVAGHDSGPVTIRDSVVDGGGEDAVGSADAPLARVALERATVLGATHATRLLARSVVFGGTFGPAEDPELTVDVASSQDRRPPSFASTRYGHPRYARLEPARRGVGAFARDDEDDALERLAAVAGSFLPAELAWSIELAT